METKRQVSWYRRQILAILAELEEHSKVPAYELTELEAAYMELAKPIRTHIRAESLQKMLTAHKELHEHILEQVDDLNETTSSCLESMKMSFGDAVNVAHYNSTNHLQSNKLDTGKASPIGLQGRRNGDVNGHPQPEARMEVSPDQSKKLTGQTIRDSGIQHVTLNQAINAASSRFGEHLPLFTSQIHWRDLVEAAGRLRPTLGISQQS